MRLFKDILACVVAGIMMAGGIFHLLRGEWLIALLSSSIGVFALLTIPRKDSNVEG